MPASTHLSDIWAYLQTSPLLWLTVTLVVYQIAHGVFVYYGRRPYLNPVAWSIVVLVSFLEIAGVPYQTYFAGAQFIHFLLGPATVALAIPLYVQLPRMRVLWLPLLGALIVGSLTAVCSGMGIAWLLGASHETVLSLAPKSVTTPIAMGIAEKIGAIPSLAAVFVILTGILGAMTARYVMAALRITDHGVQGFAIGLAAHGIGTAKAFQLVSEEAGAFSGLAMGLNGVLTALLLPLVMKLIS